MKYLTLSLLLITVLFTLIFLVLISSEVDIFYIWATAPLIFSVAVAVEHLRGKLKSDSMAIAGVIVGFLALPFYYDAYSYQGPDGQAGLIFVVMPVYQTIIICIVGITSYIASHLSKGTD